MDVSVIIVNYKTSELIIDCVKSIMGKSSGITYEIIIVDNNSDSSFQEVITSSLGDDKTPEVHFIALPENIGFGRANNEGLKMAKGRNIFFLNPDTIITNNAIKILSDFLDNHPEAGACGGNLLDEKMEPNFSFKRWLPGIRWETNELLNCIPQKLCFGSNSYFNFTRKPLEVAYITGADLMVKRKVLDRIGAFRNEYFLYFEETDLCFRIKKNGWKIYSVPDAEIQHLESKSFSGKDSYQSEFKTRCIEKSRKIFYALNKGKTASLLSNSIYILFLSSRILLIKNDRKKDYYLQRLKYFKEK